jgi:hypothetical protein
LTRKTRLTIKRSTISIRLTVYTEDKAVSMAADDTASVKKATIAMATIAAITIGEATREEAEKDTKAFNKKNTTYTTNQDAGLTSIP